MFEIKFLIVLISLNCVFKLTNCDCWWTGCQPRSWEIRGCNDPLFGEKSSEKCEDEASDKFQCCPAAEIQPNNPDNGQCWWSGCQPKKWAVRGCNDKNFEKKASASCLGGDKFLCCNPGYELSPNFKVKEIKLDIDDDSEKKDKKEKTDEIIKNVDNTPAVINKFIPSTTFLYRKKDDGKLSQKEFNDCMEGAGFPVPAGLYDLFIAKVEKEGGMDSKLEKLMGLIQMAFESSNFQTSVEPACTEKSFNAKYCTSYEKKGCPKDYFARGFIRLTNCAEYRAASNALYGDDILVTNPELVSNNAEVALSTSMWAWKEKVHFFGGARGFFGRATCAINCDWYCRQRPEIGRERWEKFEKCLKSADLEYLTPLENGCYN